MSKKYFCPYKLILYCISLLYYFVLVLLTGQMRKSTGKPS